MSKSNENSWAEDTGDAFKETSPQQQNGPPNNSKHKKGTAGNSSHAPVPIQAGFSLKQNQGTSTSRSQGASTAGTNGFPMPSCTSVPARDGQPSQTKKPLITVTEGQQPVTKRKKPLPPEAACQPDIVQQYGLKNADPLATSSSSTSNRRIDEHFSQAQGKATTSRITKAADKESSTMIDLVADVSDVDDHEELFESHSKTDDEERAQEEDERQGQREYQYNNQDDYGIQEGIAEEGYEDDDELEEMAEDQGEDRRQEADGEDNDDDEGVQRRPRFTPPTSPAPSPGCASSSSSSSSAAAAGSRQQGDKRKERDPSPPPSSENTRPKRQRTTVATSACAAGAAGGVDIGYGKAGLLLGHDRACGHGGGAAGGVSSSSSSGNRHAPMLGLGLGSSSSIHAKRLCGPAAAGGGGGDRRAAGSMEEVAEDEFNKMKMRRLLRQRSLAPLSVDAAKRLQMLERLNRDRKAAAAAAAEAALVLAEADVVRAEADVVRAQELLTIRKPVGRPLGSYAFG